MKWPEVLENKELSNLSFKVELNEWGNIVMPCFQPPWIYPNTDYS